MKAHYAFGLLIGAGMLMPHMAWAQSQDTAVEADESEEIVVQATRSGRRVQDEPVKVEVLNREEIEEKILMRPGNVAMILSETGGLRVQVTAPALGAANIRVQGMDGRFTQLLADGLPLYGGQASSLGLLQIPPTDLGQVEVIKGAASALYGPSALGGVINLVSRRPRGEAEGEVLLNATSRNGQDVTAYVAAPLGGGFSGSITGGHHRQGQQDLDSDGWVDTPGYTRWTARPRLFWEGASGAKLYATAGAMTEQRRGGGMTPGGTLFPQDQGTDRYDAGLVAEAPLGDAITAHVRGSVMVQDHRHVFGDVAERDRHDTNFAEASLSGKAGETAWIAGIAYQQDSFHSRTFPAFDYRYESPGIFGQIERDLTEKLTLAASARIDFHNRYGTQFSPRLSLLYRTGPFSVRASGGRGFYAPTPFIEEVEAAGLSRLEPLSGLKAETATTASLDIGYAKGPVEANLTFFGSDIANSTELVTTAPTRVRLVNLPGPSRIRGSELMLRRRWGSFVVTGSYVYVDASEPQTTGGRRITPLTPRHSAGIVAMWEKHDKGRVGLELYYTGKQQLDDNPYRSQSRPYFDLGFLAEKAIGKARIFVNAENILNVRQSKYEPLLRPVRAADGRWTVDAWAPIDGFVVNAGIRLKFGGE